MFSGNLLLYVSLVVSFKDIKNCSSVNGNNLTYFFAFLSLKHEPKKKKIVIIVLSVNFIAIVTVKTH